MKKILLFAAKGFETMEFSPFVDIFGWARNDYGEDVEVVTCGFTKEVISAFHILVRVDVLIDDVEISEYDALAVPGGFEEFGFYEEAYDEKFLSLIRAFEQQKKIIASICVGTLPLGKSGVLKGRRATTYHLNGARRQKQLAEFGVQVINEPIVSDDNIITSYCPQTAPGVAFLLLEKLIGEKKTDVIREAMGYYGQ